MIMTLKKQTKKTTLLFLLMFIHIILHKLEYVHISIHKHEKVHSSNISVLQITKNPQFKIVFSSLVLREKKQKQQ